MEKLLTALIALTLLTGHPARATEQRTDCVTSYTQDKADAAEAGYKFVQDISPELAKADIAAVMGEDYAAPVGTADHVYLWFDPEDQQYAIVFVRGDECVLGFPAYHIGTTIAIRLMGGEPS